MFTLVASLLNGENISSACHGRYAVLELVTHVMFEFLLPHSYALWDNFLLNGIWMYPEMQ